MNVPLFWTCCIRFLLSQFFLQKKDRMTSIPPVQEMQIVFLIPNIPEMMLHRLLLMNWGNFITNYTLNINNDDKDVYKILVTLFSHPYFCFCLPFIDFATVILFVLSMKTMSQINMMCNVWKITQTNYWFVYYLFVVQIFLTKRNPFLEVLGKPWLKYLI